MLLSMKISLLALTSVVAAVPQYGGHGGHSKFHSMKPSGAHGTGAGKPYPTGGWSNGYNSTRVPEATAAGSYGGDTTIDVTSTSTTTLLKTVVVKPSASGTQVAVVENATPAAVVENVTSAADECGPATVTVTASEKVTVTVTPGGGAGVPKSSAVPQSSAAPVESKGDGYGVPSSFALASPTPQGEVVASSSKVEEVKPTPTPEQASSKAPETPSSSKAAEEYKVSSVVQMPVVSATPEVSATPVASSVVATSAAASSVVASSAAASATPSSVNTYSGAKRGLAYNEATLCKSFGSNFGFGYNWGQVENNDIGTNFIPMMHGPTKATSTEWLANVEKAVAKGSTAVMGFNEPDMAAQANLTPEAACTSWKEYMNPIASSHPDVTIIGPSVTNGAAPLGLDWLSRFHEACPDAVVHATNIHFYDIYAVGTDEGHSTIMRFKAQIEKAAEIYGKPVWITEFGLNPGSASEEQAASFLKEAMDYCDGSDKVQGYSWFMVGTGENQLNSGTGLSAVGQVYAGAS